MTKIILLILYAVMIFILGWTWGSFMSDLRHNKTKQVHNKRKRNVERDKQLRDKTFNKYTRRMRQLSKIKPPHVHDQHLSDSTNHLLNVIVNKEFECRKRLIANNIFSMQRFYTDYYSKVILHDMGLIKFKH